MNEQVCNNCFWWETDDGSPYCIMKDLYTYTEPDHQCDETNYRHELYFSPKPEL